MIAASPQSAVMAVAEALPFPDASFGSVTMLCVLYHLEHPRQALAEADRVLRPGGLIVIALRSRHDSPELAHPLPREPLTADAESVRDLMSGLFNDVEVAHWDAPLLRLMTRDEVRDYLVGKGARADVAARAAAGVETPAD